MQLPLASERLLEGEHASGASIGVLEGEHASGASIGVLEGEHMPAGHPLEF